MKLILALTLAAASTCSIAASTQVDGYMRKDGTYVPPHYRTTPDDSRMNNWSTQGNVNPYTGERGTVNPYAAPTPSQPIYPSSPWTEPPRRRY